MRVNMWGNEGTAEGGGLGTSGLHPQCCQNPHKHPSSRTEVLAAFPLWLHEGTSAPEKKNRVRHGTAKFFLLAHCIELRISFQMHQTPCAKSQ